MRGEPNAALVAGGRGKDDKKQNTLDLLRCDVFATAGGSAGALQINRQICEEQWDSNF